MNTHKSVAEIQFRLNVTARPAGRTALQVAPAAENGQLPRVTQILALAIEFQDMIQSGEVHDYADLARLGCLTRERTSQIMELIWLASDIQREILEFPPTRMTRFPISEVAVRRIASHLSWAEQRRQWNALKGVHHLD